MRLSFVATLALVLCAVAARAERLNPVHWSLVVDPPTAAPGGTALFLGVTTVDGTPAMDTFTQSILGGKTDAKSALTTLQNSIKANLKS